MPKAPTKIPRNAENFPLDCDSCDGTGTVIEKNVQSRILIRDEKVSCLVPKAVCSSCDAAFTTVSQANRGIEIAVAEYQRTHNLLTSREIKDLRQQQSLTQQDLATEAKVGIASIKRWEQGRRVQTEANDHALRHVFSLNKGFDSSDFVIVCQSSSVIHCTLTTGRDQILGSINPSLKTLPSLRLGNRSPFWGITDTLLTEDCYA